MSGEEESNAHDATHQLRRVREARRDAVRQVRQSARDAHRQAAEQVREATREAREMEREAVRAVRNAGRDAANEGGTRARIQRVAVELFTENGYEATSLREIAERLGVTKAALYYHFKTKDEIIDSLVAERMERVRDLVDWASGQPRTIQTRREILRRYSDMLFEQNNHAMMRFFERNQSSMTQHKAGTIMRERMLELLDQITDRDAPLADQIRSSLAIFALHSTFFTVRDPGFSEVQRREAALSVALDLLERGLSEPRDPGATPAD